MKYLILIVLLVGCKFFKKNILYSGKFTSEKTRGNGKAEVEIFDKDIIWAIEISDLSGVPLIAHFHCYPSGKIAATMTPSTPWEYTYFAQYSGRVTEPDKANGCGITTQDELIELFEDKKIYINVHTVKHPAGEIKADLIEMPKKNLIERTDRD